VPLWRLGHEGQRRDRRHPERNEPNRVQLRRVGARHDYDPIPHDGSGGQVAATTCSPFGFISVREPVTCPQFPHLTPPGPREPLWVRPLRTARPAQSAP